MATTGFVTHVFRSTKDMTKPHHSTNYYVHLCLESSLRWMGDALQPGYYVCFYGPLLIAFGRAVDVYPLWLSSQITQSQAISEWNNRSTSGRKFNCSPTCSYYCTEICLFNDVRMSYFVRNCIPICLQLAQNIVEPLRKR